MASWGIHHSLTFTKTCLFQATHVTIGLLRILHEKHVYIGGQCLSIVPLSKLYLDMVFIIIAVGALFIILPIWHWNIFVVHNYFKVLAH